MRFAHLSVQEYLETRKNSWGVIDALLLVSEACLWTLQCGTSRMPAFYDYAGSNWFVYCRSYQDIALSQHSQDPDHALDIPILNTFLGSFDLGSIHFAKWVSWIKENKVGMYDGDLALYYYVPSTPPRPAFAAAACGSVGFGTRNAQTWISRMIKMIHCYILLVDSGQLGLCCV